MRLGDGTKADEEIIRSAWDDLPQKEVIQLYLRTSTVNCVAIGYRYGNDYGAFRIISVAPGGSRDIIIAPN